MLEEERYVRVEGDSHLYRDRASNAIINTNMKEYEDFKNRARQKNKLNKLPIPLII